MQITTVYACVRVLAEAVAGLPLHLYQYKKNSKEKATKHSLYRILHDEPNEEMTSFIWRETMMCHLLLNGNAYAQIIREGSGKILALYPLMPDKMSVDRAPNGQIIYSYRRTDDDSPTLGKGSTVVLPSDQVFHIPGLGYDGLVGYSPIAMAKNSIGMAIATEEYGAKFFANGATPSAVLEHPGVIKNIENLRSSWASNYGGSANAHRVAILEEGLVYKPISISPEQAQFLESRKFQVSEIARIFRVPPHMIGDLERSTFSNIEQQALEFVKYSIGPWLVRWEQAMHRALLLDTEKDKYFLKFNVDGLLRGDYQSRMSGYATGRQNGWMSANDIRELEDLDKIPAELGGDDYLVNGSMTRLNDAGAAYRKGDQQADPQENSATTGDSTAIIRK
jgi:HK97 family phage portal protein